MRYIEFAKNFRNKIINIQDLLVLDPDFDINRLSDWQKKEYISKLRRNFYLLNETAIDDGLILSVANSIYQPSYISLESALSLYNLIPETIYATTSISTRKSNSFSNILGRFTYKAISTKLFWGYTIKEIGGREVLVADIEKSLLDFLYLHPEVSSDEDFFEMRFNFDEFSNQYNKKKLEKYLRIFNQTSLAKRTNSFLDYQRSNVNN